MKAAITHRGKIFEVDLSDPIDISIPLTDTDENPIAWYLDKPVIEPVTMGEWIGKVSEVSSTNFNNIFFNPHGHGTHTECLGHITRKFYSVNKMLIRYHWLCELITISPEAIDGDLVITKKQIEAVLKENTAEALVIRTLPNEAGKTSQNYSNTNPPYLEEAAAAYIRDCGIVHLIIDLPSVDREKDEGKLLAHKAFWNVTDVNDLNEDARLETTITEMAFIPNGIFDGPYLLNLQLASFENDASPSKPVLYKIL